MSTADLLAKYDRPGPRYTSYPTAVEFHEGFTPERYLEKLDQAASRKNDSCLQTVREKSCFSPS